MVISGAETTAGSMPSRRATKGNAAPAIVAQVQIDTSVAATTRARLGSQISATGTKAAAPSINPSISPTRASRQTTRRTSSGRTSATASAHHRRGGLGPAVAAGVDEERNEQRQGHHLSQRILEDLQDVHGQRGSHDQHQQPEGASAGNAHDRHCQIWRLCRGAGSLKGRVLALFGREHVHGVIDGQHAHQTLLGVDHRQGDQPLGADQPGCHLLVRVGGHELDVGVHQVADQVVPVGHHQRSQPGDADQVTLVVEHGQCVDRFCVDPIGADLGQRLTDGHRRPERDKLRAHQATGRLLGVPEQRRGEREFLGAQRRQKSVGHLGGHLVEQAHAVVGVEFLDQVHHPIGPQPAQQTLLIGGLEGLEYLGRPIAFEQPECDAHRVVVQPGQLGDEVAHSHRGQVIAQGLGVLRAHQRGDRNVGSGGVVRQ